MTCYKFKCSHWWKIYLKKNPLQDLLSSLNAVISTNESTEFVTGHVIYKLAYTYKFQLKTTQAMACLQECNGLVKVEDILPFFPNFVTIDHFKDAICDSLQEYSTHIQELKDEMEEAYGSAERIRKDMSSHKGKNNYDFYTQVTQILCNKILYYYYHFSLEI